MSFTLEQYNIQKPFSSFLSGIAGEKGIPMWAYYVNRGQLFSGFGLFHKNNAIMEFFPANQAYENVNQLGFKTFLKHKDIVFECFQVEHAKNQSMHIDMHEVKIKEFVEVFNVNIEITYFTLAHELIPGLVRRVDITYLDASSKDIEIVDGLTHILPANLDAGLLKNMSNTLRSWFRSYISNDTVHYHLSASIGDSAKVELVKDVNTYQTFGLDSKIYITDLRLIYGNDTSYHIPLGLIKGIDLNNQHSVNQIQAAMTHTVIKNSVTFMSLFSSVKEESMYHAIAKSFDLAYLIQKQKDNQALHQGLTTVVSTETAHQHFNEYLEQSYMDNVLRGGTPLMLDTVEGLVPYYIYSRKHGDLERDYNFFMLEPNVLSQGNGNFRDVLQNRRNDLFFEPNIKAFNIFQFFSYIQADGYNPLNVSGLVFHFEGEVAHKDLKDFLKSGYTPGGLWTFLNSKNLLDQFDTIIKQSRVEYVAHFHEGYWEDHFTYLYDLLESYEAIYPDEMKSMLFDRPIHYFVSDAVVNPRSEKYVLNQDGNVRQYNALTHVKRGSHWLLDAKGLKIEASVFSKILTLAVNKFSHFDPEFKGLMYEAGKPGWNDAMNGLPGLFGSGVSEVFELGQLVSFLRAQAKTFKSEKISILRPLLTLIHTLEKIDLKDFNERLNALEFYRLQLEKPLEVITLEVSELIFIIDTMHEVLEHHLNQHKDLKDVETYITYEADQYEVLNEVNSEGFKKVHVKSFKKVEMPLFLEGYARLLKRVRSKDVANHMNDYVKTMPMFDDKLCMYKTSNPIQETSFEVGRIKAFTPGWLERESIFLHMTYKYVLGLLVSGAYETYYEALKTNMICFLDPKVYGRSILENSSFIASSNNPDPHTHGQGFVARLSGSTAELLSMWRYMFLGKKLFSMKDNGLSFEASPNIPYSWFKDDVIKTTLFSHTSLIYKNKSTKDTWKDVKPVSYTLTNNDGKVTTIDGSSVDGEYAYMIRNKSIKTIEVVLI
jgi:hypothetical protein